MVKDQVPMLLLNRERLEAWLKITGRNPAWLAAKMGYTRAYVSLIMANKCKMSRAFISQIMDITHIPYESLFTFVRAEDDREFFGSEIFFQGRMIQSKKYNAMLNRFKQNYAEKNFVDTAQV